MNLDKFQQLLDEGKNAGSFKQFHFTMIKTQIHWVAYLGHRRWQFILITLLGFPLTLFCFWLGYITDFTNQDSSDWPLLAKCIWWFMAIPAITMPIIYPIHLLVSVVTGAFTAEFWGCVYSIRSNEKLQKIETGGH